MYGSTNRKLPIKVHRVIISPNSANDEEVTWFNLDLVIGQLSYFCIFVFWYWPTFLYFDLIYKILTYKEPYHVSIFFIKPMENHKKFCKIVWLLISYIISWHDTINVPLFKFWWLIFHGFGPKPKPDEVFKEHLSHRRNEERAQGTPNKEQKGANKEQNWKKRAKGRCCLS